MSILCIKLKSNAFIVYVWVPYEVALQVKGFTLDFFQIHSNFKFELVSLSLSFSYTPNVVESKPRHYYTKSALALAIYVRI